MEVVTHANETSINTTLGVALIQPQATFEIGEEFYNTYAKIVNTILTPLVCVFGICGNGLGTFILWNDMKYQKQSIYRYMLALMMFDNACLLAGLLFGITMFIEIYDWFLANALLMHMIFVTGTLDMIVYHTTSSLLVVMSLERLNALLRPLTYKQTWVNRFPLRIIVVIFVVCFTFALPFPLGVELITLPKDNRTAYYFRSRPEILSFHRNLSSVETVISCFYPVLMLIFNITIPISYWHYLKQKRTRVRETSSNDTQQRRITLMVLWVMGFYLLLSVPKVFLQIIIFFVDIEYDHDGKFNRTFFFFTSTGDFFARVNAANDFLLYVLVSERYRKILSMIWSSWCSKSEGKVCLRDIFRNASHEVGRSKSEKDSQSTKISIIDSSGSVAKVE